MLCRSLLTIVLAGCCVLLTGCPAAEDTPVGDSATGPPSVKIAPRVPIKAAVPRPPLRPSVKYVPLDAPAGMSQAVVVDGYPLVHTRQLLPLDGKGKLVGEGSAEKQTEQALSNLETVLDAAGSGLGRLVRLNVVAASPQTADAVREQLSKRLDAVVRPAITTVVSPLPDPKALVAVDAVAIAAEQVDTVALGQCEGVTGDKECADFAVMPHGGVAYLSGQPDKSPLAEATIKSLTTLLGVVGQLKLERSQIVLIKVFIDSAPAADRALAEIKKLFPGQLTPPVVFVEWIASAPIEIEMIISRPLTPGMPDQTVSFYTPPGVEPSPTFSRVALVDSTRQIYISGLSARKPGNGEAQVRDVFAQLTAILAETGSDLGHLAKATYYVSDKDVSDMLNKLRPEFYDPTRPPGASKATVRGVGKSDCTLTIDMIAVGTDR